MNKHSSVRVMMRLIQYVGKHKKLLILAVALSVIGNTMGLFIPFFIGKGINTMVGAGKVDFKELWNIVTILVTLSFLSTIIYWVDNIAINKVAHRTIHNIRQEAFEQLCDLELNYFDTHSHGDILSRLSNDIEALTEGILQGAYQAITNIVSLVGAFIFMMLISRSLTVLVLIITPICFVIAYFVAKNSASFFKKQSQTLGDLNGYVEEMVGNHSVVKSFNYGNQAKIEFEQINQKLKTQGQKSQFYSSLTNPSTRLINNISYLCVCLFGGIAAISSGVSIGMISSFLNYSTQFARPINDMTSVATQLQGAFAAARRIFEIVDEKKEKETGEQIFTTTSGNVEFSKVDFSYNKNKAVISNLSLFAKTGDTIAIVGKTGAGKTTLVNLLMRFYDVDAGAILLDGKDINLFTRNSVRESMAMVLQDAWLFSGTIFENIAYGRKDATREQVVKAAKKAYAHGFINRLTNGYETIVAQDGEGFSQGEKQLITIARAMCAKAPILILDEATSSVDTKTEKKIQKAFLEIMKGKTSFVIAHRLSTIQDADLILVLDQGNIVEMGKHFDLLNKKGYYDKLYRSQFEI